MIWQKTIRMSWPIPDLMRIHRANKQQPGPVGDHSLPTLPARLKTDPRVGKDFAALGEMETSAKTVPTGHWKIRAAVIQPTPRSVADGRSHKTPCRGGIEFREASINQPCVPINNRGTRDRETTRLFLRQKQHRHVPSPSEPALAATGWPCQKSIH